MKNKLYLVGGIAIAAGIAVFMAGFSQLGFDISRVTTQPPYTEKTYTAKADCTVLDITDKNVPVELTAADVETVSVTYMENEQRTYEISETNGTLRIEKKEKLRLQDFFFNVSFVSPVLKIQVPRDFAGVLNVKTSNAEISAQSISAKEGQFATSNASVLLRNVTSAGALSVDTQNGRVALEQVETAGLTCSTTNNSIVLSDVTAQNVRAESTNGEIGLYRVTSATDIFANTTNDGIRMEAVDFAGALTCRTANGEVAGTVRGAAGDFSFTTHTVNGDNNLPESLESGAKQININTSNDSIRVDFIAK